MDAKNLINKYKNIVINLIILLLAVRFAVGLYKKHAKNIALLSGRKDTEIKNNQVLAGISQLQDELKVYKAFVNNKDIALSIPTLTNIAEGSSVKIISVKPQPEQGYPLHIKYPFDLRVEANNYHALGKFISVLESHPDIYNVESVKIAPQTGSKKQGEAVTLVVDLRISTILLKN
jgi:Tfp pilus assembly protein PilO